MTKPTCTHFVVGKDYYAKIYAPLRRRKSYGISLHQYDGRRVDWHEESTESKAIEFAKSLMRARRIKILIDFANE